MASATAHNASDFIPADKNCDNCCADSKAKVACPLCWDGLLQKCKTKKPKNKTTKKPKSNPLEKNKHAYVHRLLDSAPEGDENDDYIFGLSSKDNEVVYPTDRPLPAYLRRRLHDLELRESKKSMETDAEKNEKKIV